MFAWLKDGGRRGQLWVWEWAGRFWNQLFVMSPGAGYVTSSSLSLPIWRMGPPTAMSWGCYTIREKVCSSLPGIQSLVITWNGIEGLWCQDPLGRLLIWDSGILLKKCLVSSFTTFSHLHLHQPFTSFTINISPFHFGWQDTQHQICGSSITTSADGMPCPSFPPFLSSLTLLFIYL